MLCQRCGQRQATVFFSQTVGNQTTQAHLCEVCAQEQSQAYGAINPFAALSDLLNNFLNLGEGAIAEINPGRAGSTSVDPPMQCPHCGYQLSAFRQNGRLGCTRCYESFQKILEPLISSIHGTVRHQEETAETPAPPAAQPAPKEGEASDVQGLREKLKHAIAKEKFEEAARLRDEIKKREGK